MVGVRRYSSITLVSAVVGGLLVFATPTAQAATSSDIVSTVAGNGTEGTPMEGPGTASPLSYPSKLAVAPTGSPHAGHVYFNSNEMVWRLSPTGEMVRFAGGGTGFTDGEPARDAELSPFLSGIDVAPDGQVYVSSTAGDMFRIDNVGDVHLMPADASARTHIGQAKGIDVDSQGRVYLAAYGNGVGNVVVRLGADGSVVNIAGDGSIGCGPIYDKPPADGGVVINTQLDSPRDVALSEDETAVFVADGNNHVIKRVPIGNAGAYTVVEGICDDYETGTSFVSSVDVQQGKLYWASRNQIGSSDGVIGGIQFTSGYSGDGGPVSAATFNQPAVAVADDGVLYVGDSFNHRVRRVGPAEPDPQLHTLTVTHAGDAWGAITGTGIACGVNDQLDCSEDLEEGTSVTLSAEPAGGSRFDGWSGCTEIVGDDCVVTMTSDREVVATFNPTPKHLLTVTRSGSGAGTVSGTGIDCGTSCSHSYEAGTHVSLTAAPTSGSRFGGWSGCDLVVDGACQVTMDEAKGVTASFVARHELSIVHGGAASGTVSGTGIDCGDDCSETYDDGTSVTLTATPTGGSMLAGWSGCNSIDESHRCVVTMTSARQVVATFEPAPKHTLTVSRAGTGTGKVTGTGIDCGVTCIHSYEEGTLVTLTATPAAGVWFDGWTGCSDIVAGECVVAMTQARSVTATFTDIPEHQLTVTVTGAGSGSVLGQGISCGADCTQSFLEDTEVTLVATADEESTFEGWTGCDTVQEGDCVVTMDAARAVTATFEPTEADTRTLTVEKSGKGAGTVTATGIDCGDDCGEAYPIGTVVVLEAVPAPGSTFKGWANCDSTAGKECVVTVGTDRIVGAKFASAAGGIKTEITSSTIRSVQRRATFEFTGSSPHGAVSFQCKLDAQKWKNCTSARTYRRLRPGSHTFQVRTVDGHGLKDLTPAEEKFVIRRP